MYRAWTSAQARIACEPPPRSMAETVGFEPTGLAPDGFQVSRMGSGGVRQRTDPRSCCPSDRSFLTATVRADCAPVATERPPRSFRIGSIAPSRGPCGVESASGPHQKEELRDHPSALHEISRADDRERQRYAPGPAVLIPLEAELDGVDLRGVGDGPDGHQAGGEAAALVDGDPRADEVRRAGCQ
jgi:hypothetical protein